MRAQEFIREDVDGQQVLDYIHGTHHEPLTTQLQQAVLSHPRWELRSVPLSSLHIPDQEYDDEDPQPESDPYNRVQSIDPEHAGEYSAGFVDRRPIVVDADGWIIDGNHRAWAASELLNRPTIRAWVPANQLNELGNAPVDYQANRKRKRSLFHATVDEQWVDVFFDRSEFNDTLHITFAVNGDYDAPKRPTSASKSTVKILSTVLNIVKQKLPEYIKKSRPPAISFTSKQDNRTSLYRKYFVPVMQNILGPKWEHEEYTNMGMTVFNWLPVKKQQGVAEGSEQNLSVQQLATISDEALDKAYGYGRSNPGNTFGWQANLMSAAYAKKMIDAGVTDIEKISDAIHKGWNVTAQKFVQNPDQFDDTEKLRQAGKLEAKLAQRAKLMKINYGQLDNEEQEKDRVVARALLQAIKGQQGVAENFADGRNPQDKGDSKRHGVPTKASVSTLRKVAKQGGRKGQLAHWMANMKAGRAKAKKK